MKCRSFAKGATVWVECRSFARGATVWLECRCDRRRLPRHSCSNKIKVGLFRNRRVTPADPKIYFEDQTNFPNRNSGRIKPKSRVWGQWRQLRGLGDIAPKTPTFPKWCKFYWFHWFNFQYIHEYQALVTFSTWIDFNADNAGAVHRDYFLCCLRHKKKLPPRGRQKYIQWMERN